MATGNTAVLTYPDIGKLFNDEPVSHFSLIRNGFTETMPRQIKGLSAEAARRPALASAGMPPAAPARPVHPRHGWCRREQVAATAARHGITILAPPPRP